MVSSVAEQKKVQIDIDHSTLDELKLLQINSVYR